LIDAVPLAFVRTIAEGVPRAGVTRVGLLLSTTLVVPVEVVTPVPPFATGKVPVTPVVKGSPVALVSTAADGVPRFGVVRLGLEANTSAPDPVSSLTAAARFALDGVPRNVATPEPRLVSPVPPFATDTGVVSEKTDPVSVSPVPAVKVPAPENCDHGRAVVPSVPPAFAVQTKPQSAFVVPCSIKVKAEVSSSHVSASVVRVHAPDAQR